MFKLTQKRRLQLIGFLVIFLLVLTFLPLLFTEQPHQNVEKIALKQENAQSITSDKLESNKSSGNEAYQNLGDFITQNEFENDNLVQPAELTHPALENTPTLAQHSEVEPLGDSEQIQIIQSPTTQKITENKVTMDDLIGTLDQKANHSNEANKDVITPIAITTQEVHTNTIEKSRLKQNYYIRLAALTRLDYLEEKLQLLRKNNYITKTRKSGDFVILMAGPFISEKAAAEVLPKMIQLGFKDAKIVKE